MVGLALLRALLAAGREREFGRHVMRVRKAALGTAGTSLCFAEILTKASLPAVHRDLAEEAVARASALDAPPRLLAAARYLVIRSCVGDAAAAKAFCAEYCAKVEQGGSLNEDCWSFLTDLSTQGGYDGFALAIAERMLENRGAMDYLAFDTAAMAMFRAGRIDEALKLQTTSIEQGGKTDPEYVERLRRYTAAVADAGR
ncbi:MAG: hypothetical protein H6838_19755 [Planctomycetes bacterium]|nr:hypothetical protein [Planctomycetota bacterium]